MKKILVIILLFITAAGSFIPCCQVDECCADQTTTDHKNPEPKGACSPFFTCGTCSGFVELSKPMQIIQLIPEKQVYHEKIEVFNLTDYYTSFWQPPRSC